MLRNWRAWVLLVLLVGPILAYIGFGAMWLAARGWLLISGVLWIATGIVFAILASRWTSARRELLPPLDWDAPQTFTAFDRQAWDLVEAEADQGDAIALENLTTVDIYIDTARRLTRRLAEHYHPLANDPIEHVPVVEFLTALELAAEDLNRLSRQVPGGDMVTPAHWKQAVQVAGYIQKASDIYSYLLPIFSPVTGLVRLGTQQWMVKPAWRNMQQNLLRWFYRAFVNRLGMHLIELYSGRLVIGADQYRRLTRDGRPGRSIGAAEGELVIGVAGARDSGKSRLIEAIETARSGDLSLVRARLKAAGLDDALMERLRTARLVEVPAYTAGHGAESARDRSTRREAVDEAVETDLLILVAPAARDSTVADVGFAKAWDRWYIEHPRLEIPPALVVVTMVDLPELGGDWKPPYNWSQGLSVREQAVRARLTGLRASLPPSFSEVVAVGMADRSPFGITEDVLPSLAVLVHRAERTALLRHLHRMSSRSKARRLIAQVGQQGRSLWKNIRSARKPQASDASASPS